MRVNVYIRKENEQAWNELKDKSGSVNAMLTRDPPRTATSTTTIMPDVPVVKDSVAKAKKNFEFCKNGHPIPEGKSKCMGKVCKYS